MAIYNVDSKNGNNSGLGTESSPWRTSQYAVDQAKPGDMIYFKAGSYDPFEIKVSGTANNPIVFSAAPGDEQEVVINGAGKGYHRGLIESWGESHFTLKGFKVVNAPDNGIWVIGSDAGNRGINILDNYVDLTGNAGIYAAGLQMGQTIGVNEYRLFDVVIDGNEVTNTNTPNGKNEAITVGGGINGFVISNNHVHDTDQFGIDAKQGAINGVIAGNLLHGIEKHAIYLDSNSRTVAHIEIFDNTIYDATNGIALARESNRFPKEPNIYDIDIYENSIDDVDRFGIMSYRHIQDVGTGRFDDVQIFDNKVWNAEDGVHLKGQGTNFLVAGNDLSSNLRNIVNEIGARVTSDLSDVDTSGLTGYGNGSGSEQDDATQNVVSPSAPSTPNAPAADLSSDSVLWEGKGGLVVFEAEHGLTTAATKDDHFDLETWAAGYSGDGFLSWNARNYYNEPGSGVRQFSFNLDEGGEYYLSMRAIRPDWDLPDHHNNDIYVRIDGGEWEELHFSGGRGTWEWGSAHDDYSRGGDAVFDLDPGNHVLEISGRSWDIGVDRLHLNKESVNTNNDVGETLADGVDITDPALAQTFADTDLLLL